MRLVLTFIVFVLTALIFSEVLDIVGDIEWQMEKTLMRKWQATQ